MIQRPFDIQLEKLKTKLIKMCSLVDEQVEFALRAVEEGNNSLAVLVLERDHKVDKYDIKVESICQKLFALNQPVAIDLRVIMSALKIDGNLERIGDHAVNIAINSIEIKDKPDFFGRIRFSETGTVVREMIKNAIDSFIDRDTDLAKKVLATDDTVDELVKENRRILIEIMKENPNSVENGMRYHSIFQALERLGDHASKIAEEVYFIVRAESIKHRSEEISDKEDADGY